MRDGWKALPLNDVIEHTIGGVWGGESDTDQVEVTVVRSTEFTKRGYLNFETGVSRSIKHSQLKSRELKEGDILLEKSGGGPDQPVGRVVYVTAAIPNKFVCSNFVQLVRPNSMIIEPLFLFHIMWQWHAIKRTLEFQAQTTGIRNLRTPDYLDQAIYLPPLPEQKRIVNLISSVDSYIEALQQQLESVKKFRNALVESQILELADSRLSSLKNLSTKIGSGATPRGGEEVYIETGVNLIRSQNVHDSNFVMRGLVAIEDSAAKALENVTVEDGDVLINITGASVTRCCVVDSTILPARVNQHVAIIRSDRAKILPKYLVLVLTSNEVKGFLNDIAGTGSTRQALTKTHLEDLEIPVPNISKQTEIIENSDAFDSAISKSQMALDGARILRSGLLNNLLSGEHEIPASYDKVIGAA